MYVCLCKDGATPLILAAQMSRVELCIFILRRGANVNIQDNEGRYYRQIFPPPHGKHCTALWLHL